MYKVDSRIINGKPEYLVLDGKGKIVGIFECEKFADYFREIKEKDEICRGKRRIRSYKRTQG
jgi:hypothetical protein